MHSLTVAAPARRLYSRGATTSRRRNRLDAGSPPGKRGAAAIADSFDARRPEEPDHARRASAAERLERLPLSPYHRLIFVIIALAFFFDSMDLAMMTFLLGSIKAEFGLDSAQAGLLASSSFFGMVIGAALSGMLPTASGASRYSRPASCSGAWPATCAPPPATSAA